MHMHIHVYINSCQISNRTCETSNLAKSVVSPVRFEIARLKTSDLKQSGKKDWKRNGNNLWELWSDPCGARLDEGVKAPPLAARPGILWVFATLYCYLSIAHKHTHKRATDYTALFAENDV